MRLFAKLLLPLVFLGLLAFPGQPARAAQQGYLWSLYLDFENNFDGVLTIEVGPWANGSLLSVDETSTHRVACAPVGAVALNGGDAVFSGGYISCRLDLAGTLLKHHKLVLGEHDAYASIVLYTSLETSAQNVAPIVSHPDANYQIDFTSTSSVSLLQTLNNTIGQQSGFLAGVVSANRVKYGFEYGCAWAGPCSTTFRAGTQNTTTPIGGGMVRFRTAPTTLLVGGDGVSSFQGRMGELLLDPGNSVQ